MRAEVADNRLVLTVRECGHCLAVDGLDPDIDLVACMALKMERQVRRLVYIMELLAPSVRTATHRRLSLSRYESKQVEQVAQDTQRSEQANVPRPS